MRITNILKKISIPTIIFTLITLYLIFGTINSLRRDYNQDLSLFPLFFHILILSIVIGLFLVSLFILAKRWDVLRDSKIITRIKTFVHKVNDTLFEVKKIKVILSIVIIIGIIYGFNYLRAFIHEFGHAFFLVLSGGAYNRFEIQLYYGGGVTYFSSFYLVSSMPLINIILIYLGGILGEIIFGSVLLIYIYFIRNKRTKFDHFISTIILIVFFLQNLAYFSFTPFFGISSDASILIEYYNVPLPLIFFTFFPIFIIMTFIYLKIFYTLYKTGLKPQKGFIIVYFIGLILNMIIFHTIVKTLVEVMNIPPAIFR